jgi:hypothetical protein
MTEKKFVPGSIIKVAEEKAEVIKSLSKSLEDNKTLANILMHEAAKKYETAEREFWKAIEEMFPELAGWKFSVRPETGELIVARSLRIDEKEKRDKRLEDN